MTEPDDDDLEGAAERAEERQRKYEEDPPIPEPRSKPHSDGQQR